MQIVRENEGRNLVRSYAAGEVRIGGQAYRHSLAVSAEALLPEWRHAGVEALTVRDLEAVLALQPEILVLGTGDRQRFPPPALLADLAGRGVGLEVMDNAAACRTFNVLVSERRQVVLALMLAPHSA